MWLSRSVKVSLSVGGNNRKGKLYAEENMVDFAPENVIVKDGYLILRLTKSVKQDFPNDFPRDN